MFTGRKLRRRDAHVQDVDRAAPADPGHLREASGPTAPELVGLHGHLDAARATL
jgi:hypothetical protein